MTHACPSLRSSVLEPASRVSSGVARVRPTLICARRYRCTAASAPLLPAPAFYRPLLPLDGRAIVVEKFSAVGRAEPGDHLAHAGDRRGRGDGSAGAAHVALYPARVEADRKSTRLNSSH